MIKCIPILLAVFLSCSTLYSSDNADSTPSRSRKDILGPVKQVQVKAHTNKKVQYRSAKKAFFLSLALPGAGQFYVGGQTKNYLKAALFVTVEAALVGGWYYYSIHRYSQKSTQAKKYADAHFNTFAYDSLTTTIYYGLDGGERQFQEQYLGNIREQYCASVYSDEAIETDGCMLQDQNDRRHLERVKEDEINHRNELYGVMESDALIFGWSDVQRTDLTVWSQSNFTKPLGSSEYYNQYVEYRNQAREYESMRTWFFVGVLINHIASAVDALISAQANNALLYDGEMVWYRRINVMSNTRLVNAQFTTDFSIAMRF